MKLSARGLHSEGKVLSVTPVGRKIRKAFESFLILKAEQYNFMNLIPYKRIKVKSEYNPGEIKAALTKLVSKPDWNISIDKVANNRILEGKVSEKSFVIVMGRYGLTYGKTSLLPIMKGKIEGGNKTGSFVTIVIRPLKPGIFILSLFYLLCIVGLYFSFRKNLSEVFIVCCIFICVTYFSIISKFNKEAKIYTDLIRDNL